MLSSIHDAVWPRFCAIIGRPDLAADQRWTGRTRNVDGEAFRTLIETAFVGRTTSAWMDELGPAGVLATPAASYRDVLDDERARASGYVHSVEHADLGVLRITGHPIGFSDAGWRDAGRAPSLSANTDAVLCSIASTTTRSLPQVAPRTDNVAGDMLSRLVKSSHTSSHIRRRPRLRIDNASDGLTDPSRSKNTMA